MVVVFLLVVGARAYMFPQSANKTKYKKKWSGNSGKNKERYKTTVGTYFLHSGLQAMVLF